jgi:hypothetical protein
MHVSETESDSLQVDVTLNNDGDPALLLQRFDEGLAVVRKAARGWEVVP